jgi:hypothetical protein
LETAVKSNAGAYLIFNQTVNTFHLLDPLNGSIYIFDKKSRALRKRYTIDSILVNKVVSSFLDNRVETKTYNKYVAALKTINIGRMKINPTFSSGWDDYWVVQMSYTAPQFDTIQQKLIVVNNPFYLFFSADSIIAVRPVENIVDSTYVGLSVSWEKDTMFISRTGQSQSSELFISKHHITDDMVEFCTFLNVRIPSEYRESGLNYQLLHPIFRASDAFLPLSREYVNLKQNESSKLPLPKNQIDLVNGEIDYDFYIRDVFYDTIKGLFILLIERDKSYYIYGLDQNLRDIMYCFYLDRIGTGTMTEMPTFIKLLNSQTVICLDLKKTKFTFYSFLTGVENSIPKCTIKKVVK